MHGVSGYGWTAGCDGIAKLAYFDRTLQEFRLILRPSKDSRAYGLAYPSQMHTGSS